MNISVPSSGIWKVISLPFSAAKPTTASQPRAETMTSLRANMSAASP